MEFCITTDLSNLPSIEFNFDEQKEELAERLTFYESLAVTPDTVRTAKEDRAKLNKLKAAIEEQRKSVKKRWNAPYAAFEKKVKEIVEMIDKPIERIDSQVKAYEEQERAEKDQQLRAYFEMQNPPEWIEFERILPPKWGNKGESIEKLQSEIDEQVKQLKCDRAQIERIYADSGLLAAILDRYDSTYDLVQTLDYAQRLAEPAIPDCTTDTDPVISGRFEVTAPKSLILALRNFMRTHGIKYEVLK